MLYMDLDLIVKNFDEQLSIYEASYKKCYSDETIMAATARKSAVLALAAGYADGVCMALRCAEPEYAYKLKERWQSWAQQLTGVGR